MSWAIKVENISKQYRIGSPPSKTETLCTNLINKIKKLWLNSSVNQEEMSDAVLACSEQHIISSAQVENIPDGYFWALKDISFEINQGDRVGVLGPNGAGKSTLLKILSRITTPTVGTYRYRGRLVSLLEVGTGFHQELSGRDNIYLNAAINGMSRKAIKAKFNEIVEFSELGEQIYAPVKRYSSGMYMRLAFSVAAHLDADILIIDEVLAVGDAGFQKKCKDKMLEVAGRGRTLLFVSHDIAAIKSICNKAMQLSHGQLVEQHIPSSNNQSAVLVDVELATSQYMQQSFSMRPETVWLDRMKAPKLDDCVYLSAVRTLDKSGKIKSQFDVKESVVVEIEFYVLKPKYVLNAHIYVKTLAGEKVFLSMDNLDLENPEVIRPVGRYVERCIIQSPFLNEGVFRIEVCFFTHPTSEHGLSIEDVVMFTVTDDRLPGGVRGNWMREWNTYILRPRFYWQIEHFPL